MEENLILPTFRKLKFVDCNKPFWRKLMYRAFVRAKGGCDKWHDYEMTVVPLSLIHIFVSSLCQRFLDKYLDGRLGGGGDNGAEHLAILEEHQRGDCLLYTSLGSIRHNKPIGRYLEYFYDPYKNFERKICFSIFNVT